MEPVPETAEALRELALQGEATLEVALYAMAERIRAAVPELVGLSLGIVEEGLTLTLVASTDHLAALDAVQYVDGGPCVADVERAEPLTVAMDDLLDENRWQLYARASAAAGIASSLSLPVMEGSRVVGGLNLYADTPSAFAGKEAEIARLVGADAAHAVANADLSFSTREAALDAPGKVRETGDISVALGLISERQGVSTAVARERLRHAAAQAGVTEAQVARALKHLLLR